MSGQYNNIIISVKVKNKISEINKELGNAQRVKNLNSNRKVRATERKQNVTETHNRRAV